MWKRNDMNRAWWPVPRKLARGSAVALLMVVLTSSPGLAAEPSTGELQKERTSVTLGFGENTEDVADAGITGFRAVVAPPEATGTVRFMADGKDLGSPVPVK